MATIDRLRVVDVAPPNAADELLTLACYLKLRRRIITVVYNDDAAAIAKLALAFDDLPAGVKFTALFEDWPRERIIRECW